jgi:hypothetical protein
MGKKRKLGMHQEALKLPAPALAFRELAKLWLRKAFAAGDQYRKYKLSGNEGLDTAFMDVLNEGINHVYGFEGYQPPTIAFNQYVEGYVYCCAMNAVTSQNAPFDTVQPLRDSAKWRKEFIPKSKTKDALADGLEEREAKLLAALVDELAVDKRERTEDERISTIDFVVSEIEPRLAFCLAQLDKDRGFATEDIGEGTDPAYLDSLLSEDEQELLLGDCYRQGSKVIREGIRGVYATQVANLQRAMFNAEQERALSGIFWDIRESWVQLQRMHRVHRKLSPKEDKK